MMKVRALWDWSRISNITILSIMEVVVFVRNGHGCTGIFL
jgi:hypothetical protein